MQISRQMPRFHSAHLRNEAHISPTRWRFCVQQSRMMRCQTINKLCESEEVFKRERKEAPEKSAGFAQNILLIDLLVGEICTLQQTAQRSLTANEDSISKSGQLQCLVRPPNQRVRASSKHSREMSVTLFAGFLKLGTKSDMSP